MKLVKFNPHWSAILVSTMVLLSHNLVSQSLKRQAISCLGSSGPVEQIYLSSTVGQVYSCAGIGSQNEAVFQGFQQPVILKIKQLPKEQLSNFYFRLSPNPTSGELHVFSECIHETSQITLSDLTGKTILHQIWKNWTVQTMDLQAIPNGNYFVQISDPEGASITYQLIIHK
ncbi:MAG: T9SS type A sorting domain-containing protein [Saprospiraceae bacterium]|nr:T9SS type A sorting domain-containing protein [Saprospiraceae bacterium]